MRKADDRQMEIPMPPQHRQRGSEAWKTYEAVNWLRRTGHTVYRAGTNLHKVDGRLLNSTQLLAFYKRLCPPAPGT